MTLYIHVVSFKTDIEGQIYGLLDQYIYMHAHINTPLEPSRLDSMLFGVPKC